jgi:transposase
MSGKRYTEEFKIQAVKQVTEQGYSIPEVAKRLGLTTKSLYDWKARYGDRSGQYQKDKAAEAEIRTLKAELKRVTMERDILKEAAAFFAVESKKNTRS